MPSRPVHSVRIDMDNRAFSYDADLDPQASLVSGDTVRVSTLDARSEALADRDYGVSFELPRPTPGMGNPLSGPIYVEDAVPGDVLVIQIDKIALSTTGWCGGHAHVGPLPLGRIPRPLGRICRIADDEVLYSDSIRLKPLPMIGCIGTATEAKPQSGQPGRNGGNLDHPVLGEGTCVYLPVFVPGGYLFVGDVHGAQGDGELSGVGLETSSQVTLTVELQKGTTLMWPWFTTDETIGVMTTDLDFGVAREHAVEAMVTVLESQLELEPAEALALISIAGDLRIGQAFGGMDLTLRLELPRSLRIKPE